MRKEGRLSTKVPFPISKHVGESAQLHPSQSVGEELSSRTTCARIVRKSMV